MPTKFLLTVLLWSLAQPGLGQLKEENLVVTLPPGYKIDFQLRKGNLIMTEMVPATESVKDWTEMVTTQIFLGLKNATPEEFQADLQKRWSESCRNAKSFAVAKGQENGYTFSLWLLSCPLNPATGKPEITWIKAVKGNDSFYLVQKAFRFEPSKEQVTQWMQYLRRVIVCDTRLADRPCPGG